MNTIEKKELTALLNLLDEPSETVFERIREKLLFYGLKAIPFLEEAWEQSFNNVIQVRIEEIIHQIQLKHLRNELIAWKKKNRYDLLKGFFLASKYQYPDLDENVVNNMVEIIKRDIWLELSSERTALEKVKVINHILFDVHGFTGNKTNIDAPQNLFLNNLLESKKGNHLTIGMLYSIVAQKLGIPIFGINLPEHFVLAYVDEIHDEKIKVANEKEVLFYINPFNKGAVFTKREIEIFIKHLKISPNPAFFEPCDNVTILIRLFENMKHAFEKQGYGEKVDEINWVMSALVKKTLPI
ncbi:MAG: transglutaminase-like domain-containing protein [Bacteroidales bacterium]